MGLAPNRIRSIHEHCQTTGRSTGAARQGRQAEFMLIGYQWDIDPGERRRLLLPVGAPNRRLDDQEATVPRVAFVLDAAISDVVDLIEHIS